MFLFKNVDEKLAEIGFKKIKENRYCAEYERHDDNHGYTQRVSIMHKSSGKHILQPYDKYFSDSKGIGNTCVGLTRYEMKLFYKKMKKIGYVTKRKEIKR